MSTDTSSAPEAFASLAALRKAHADLLHGYRTGAGPALLDDIEVLMRRGAATGAILADDAERWEAQGFLDYWNVVLYRAHRKPPAEALQPFDPSLAPELPDDRCPYRGLEAFREAQHDLFFGRARVVAEMLDRLATSRLLAVVGPSGSGKSSLVLAGLIPALKAGRLAETSKAPASSRWQFLPPIVPGIRPLVSLASLPAGDDARDARSGEAAALASDPQRLAAHLDATGTPAVLVVDQFEEVFTLCTDPAEREQFTAAVLAVAGSPGPPHRVVLTIRSDFYEQAAGLPRLQAVLDDSQYRIPAFNAAELRDAIEKPAELVGLKFEEGIVPRLVNEILGEPAGLPLLQFALVKLWQHRVRNRVTFEAYRRIGGPLKALERSAEELYGSLLPEEQTTLRRILLRVVRPGTGLEVTSHRVLRESVHGNEPRERVDRVLDKLIAAGLIRQTGGPDPAQRQVEVAHEALLRNWPRLVEWLEDERVRLRRRFSVTAAARQWVAHGKDPGGLLGGTLLEEARNYDDLDASEREFVEASEAALQREAHLRERRLRILAALLVLVVALAIGLAASVLRLQQALATEKKQSHSLSLALDEADAQLRQRLTAEAEATKAQQAAASVVQAASRAVEAAENDRLQDAKSLIRETQNDIASYGQQANKVTYGSRPSGRVSASAPPSNITTSPPAGVAAPPVKGDAPPPVQGEAPPPNKAASPPAKSAALPPSKAAEPPPPTVTNVAPPPNEQAERPASGTGALPGRTPEQAEASTPRVSLFNGIAIRASAEPTGGVVESTTLPLYHFKIWLEGDAQALGRVKGVQYEFNHPTFKQKVQRSDDRASLFERGYNGWGCLSSVKVTLFPVDAQASPETMDFDMCAAVSFRYKK